MRPRWIALAAAITLVAGACTFGTETQAPQPTGTGTGTGTACCWARRHRYYRHAVVLPVLDRIWTFWAGVCRRDAEQAVPFTAV